MSVLGNDTGPAVVAEGLCKRFGETEALVDVDLVVGRAQVVGLLGPNGAGKTTTVRVFTTLIKPDRGRAFVDGIDVLAQPMRAKARIGLTGQYAAVDERLTATENLEHVGRLYHLPERTARDRGADLLERFDLVDAADRVVKGFSGGMRRRLDIAMSLIARPSVLFLDEPTTGLDPRSRQAVWDLIEELVASGTTVLLTTQYLDEADRLADDIVVIDHGRVIATGTSDVLKQQVGADRLEVKVRDTADIPRGQRRPVVAWPAGRSSPGDDATSVIVPVLDVDGLVPVAVRQLDAAGVPFADVAARLSTLDDVFFALTGRAADEDDRRPDGRAARSCDPMTTTSAPTVDEGGDARLRAGPARRDPHRPELAVQGQLDRGRAPPAGRAPQPGAAGLRHDPADHVRGPVRLRLRRIRRRPDRLQAVRHPGHLRPDGAVQLGVHRRRRGRRPAARASSTGSGRCRCTRRRSSSAGRSPTSAATSSRSP